MYKLSLKTMLVLSPSLLLSLPQSVSPFATEVIEPVNSIAFQKVERKYAIEYCNILKKGDLKTLEKHINLKKLDSFLSLTTSEKKDMKKKMKTDYKKVNCKSLKIETRKGWLKIIFKKQKNIKYCSFKIGGKHNWEMIAF